jgi:DedD protein
VPEPRTHYQISVTARQAVALFFVLLVALGVAYFFGLMTGLSGRPSAAASAEALPPTPRPTPLESLPPIETAVPTAVASGPSRTELAPLEARGAPEPTIPARLKSFDDAAEEEAAAVPTPRPGAPAPADRRPAPATASRGARYWVQVASLSSGAEASALSGRLGRHGFHSVVVPGSGPRGKVFRVRAGPYRSEEEAKRAEVRLQRQEKIRQSWVVPEGK